ncbi:NUDIX hydrolase [Acidipropionibacterium acidipropionici]|uniref:DNA mismatch repair protein MutT n=1 Tax=Acidipropionibacterium acidipropionici TaxID=1748 RepID=A0AAC8YGN1_9ACTN|nr:NUDIX domain-containing protein [Acidipropionibacterium acidipropionici]AMS06288.1 DNA mismatch repair protein MutT [Acidipropionibacterium acidipropionici]AOZ47743.1 DNA mismatch repair protein MutT [Acidipropionibacterium acidipropionici]
MILDLAAVCLLRGRSCLNVRKAGTGHVILPGGKIEPGETALEAAVREAAEEVRLHLDPATLGHLGTFEAAPANDDAEGIRCAVFVRSWDDAWAHPTPDHEIAEYEWTPLDHAADDPRQAPLLIDSVIPELLRRRLI